MESLIEEKEMFGELRKLQYFAGINLFLNNKEMFAGIKKITIFFDSEYVNLLNNKFNKEKVGYNKY